MGEGVPELDSDEFENFISEGLVLIDFYAEWCMPCLMMAPILEEVNEKLEGIKIGKINVEDSSELAQRFSVRSIPFFVLFKDGKQIETFTGGSSAEDLTERLKKFM